MITLDDIGTLATAIRRHRTGDGTDYPAAVASCLACGWIKIITEQDQREDIARWANEPHQSLSENPYNAGAYDLTPLGWRFFARQVEERYGHNLETQSAEGVKYIWDVPGWVSFLSASEGALIQELEKVLSGTDGLTFSEVGSGLQAQHTLGQIVGPYPHRSVVGEPVLSCLCGVSSRHRVLAGGPTH